MTMEEITEYIDKKVHLDEDEIIFTFYEVRIELNLTEAQADIFLSYSKTRLENLGYRVYKTGESFIFKGEARVVESNRFMIAVKE